MGEEADYQIDQMINATWWDSHYEYGYWDDPINDQIIKISREKAAQYEMEEFKMKKTYTIEVNSEKKVYRVKPPEARGSFMQRILEPEPYKEGDTPEWGCQLRWPMDDDEVKAWAGDMGKLFQKIIADKFGAQKAAEALKNPQLKIPLRNGNHESNDEYEGWLFMNVRNKFRQPIVMGPHAKAMPSELLNDSVIYSGAWYRSKLVFKYYDQIGKGIGAYIEILMKTRDDDRLDNVIDIGGAEDEFSEFASEDAGMDELAGLGDDSPFTSGDEDKKDDDFSFLD